MCQLHVSPSHTLVAHTCSGPQVSGVAIFLGSLSCHGSFKPMPTCTLAVLAVSLGLSRCSFTLARLWARNLSWSTCNCLTCIPVPADMTYLPLLFPHIPEVLRSSLLFPFLTRSYQYLHTPACCSPVYRRHHLLRYHVHSFLQANRY